MVWIFKPCCAAETNAKCPLLVPLPSLGWGRAQVNGSKERAKENMFTVSMPLGPLNIQQKCLARGFLGHIVAI